MGGARQKAAETVKKAEEVEARRQAPRQKAYEAVKRAEEVGQLRAAEERR